MLERLLSYLYLAISRDAQQVLALRLRHPAGLKWEIRDRRLTLWTLADSLVLAVDLRGHTIDQVADMAAALGCSIEYENAEAGGLSAETLLAGAGREDESNGDHFYAYTSLVYALVDAFANALEIAERDGIVEGLKQAYLDTASGEWLDLWGSYFGVPREQGELDTPYLVRMIEEVLRPRNNAYAIEQTIAKLTGADVYLREPWREIFTLDTSRLSDNDKFQDGNYYTWTVFEPVVVSFLSQAVYQRVLAVIERNRPAGVLPVARRTLSADALKILGITALYGGMTIMHGAVADMRSNVLSVNLVLSDVLHEFDVVFENLLFGSIVQGDVLSFGSSFAPARAWDGVHHWDDATWDRGICPMENTLLP